MHDRPVRTGPDESPGGAGRIRRGPKNLKSQNDPQYSDMAVQIMIPEFDKNGNLPVGIHQCSWKEFKVRFSNSKVRKRLFKGLILALGNLKNAGCSRVFVDGSFVTSKGDPGDYDACWDVRGIMNVVLDVAFKDYTQSKKYQKPRFGGDWFPYNPNKPGWQMLDTFQWDKKGNHKGIIEINLGDFDDKE